MKQANDLKEKIAKIEIAKALSNHNMLKCLMEE